MAIALLFVMFGVLSVPAIVAANLAARAKMKT